ncbi:MAG: hypothetical protein NVSMB5_04060 [Candidatus Velthaea sp.]
MPTPTLIAILGAVTIFCLIFSLIPVRNPLALRLERIKNIDERKVDVRSARIEKIATGEKPAVVRTRLLQAGWYSVAPKTFAMRGIAGFGGGVILALVLALILPNKLIAFGAGGVVALLGWRLPKISLDRAIKARRLALARALPDFLDTLSTTVKAGLALNAALISATDATVGPLKDELRAALSEIRLGRGRSEALQAMADRAGDPQLKTMVNSLMQAEMLGSNISEVVHELSVDVRNHRWMQAEERGARLPIQMIFPMAMLMLPSLYVMIFGPVAAAFMSHK